MKKSILCICSLLLVATLAGQGFAETRERTVTRGRDSMEPWQSNDAVTVSGTVHGSLQGVVRVGGREVVITKQTRIYKTGRGSIDQGTMVTNTPVYVMGVVRNGKTYARLVIVSDRKSQERSGVVRVIPPGEPL